MPEKAHGVDFPPLPAAVPSALQSPDSWGLGIRIWKLSESSALAFGQGRLAPQEAVFKHSASSS